MPVHLPSIRDLIDFAVINTPDGTQATVLLSVVEQAIGQLLSQAAGSPRNAAAYLDLADKYAVALEHIAEKAHEVIAATRSHLNAPATGQE